VPFKSLSQVRKFGSLMKQGKMSHQEFEKWANETPDMRSLPERKGKKKVRKFKLK
jgi:hypothetical protein